MRVYALWCAEDTFWNSFLYCFNSFYYFWFRNCILNTMVVKFMVIFSVKSWNCYFIYYNFSIRVSLWVESGNFKVEKIFFAVSVWNDRFLLTKNCLENSFWPIAKLVRQRSLKPSCGGSNPPGLSRLCKLFY